VQLPQAVAYNISLKFFFLSFRPCCASCWRCFLLASQTRRRRSPSSSMVACRCLWVWTDCGRGHRRHATQCIPSPDADNSGKNLAVSACGITRAIPITSSNGSSGLPSACSQSIPIRLSGVRPARAHAVLSLSVSPASATEAQALRTRGEDCMRYPGDHERFRAVVPRNNARQTETLTASPSLKAGYNTWLERGLLPDWLVRIGIRRLVSACLRRNNGSPAEQADRFMQFVAQLRQSPSQSG